MPVIYKITSPSDRVYIGQTWRWLKRNNDYKNTKARGQPLLSNSILKYGFENHKIEIIDTLSEDVCQKELDNREIYWWQHYKDLGCNMLNVREPGRGGKVSEETKLKISKNNRGLKRSSEIINKLQNLPRYNKPVLLLSLEGEVLLEFNSSKAAARYLNTVTSSFSSGLKGKEVTCKNHRVILKEFYDPLSIKRIVHKGSTKINQYDLEGNYIQSFLSIKEALNKLNIKDTGNISRACSNLQKSAYGYKWSYKNEEYVYRKQFKKRERV